MRIGILTFHKPINYGAFLQAFALSTQLSNKFKESHVEIIDYIAPLEKKKIFINVLWGVKHYGFLNGIRDLYKINSFNNAYKVLALSQKNHFDDLNDLYKFIDNTYDLLIIGSDAVFNWKQNGYPTAFIPIYSFKRCKVVSYAASVHGLRYLDEPKGRIDECGQSFDKMSLVGVRDYNTENFVHMCCEKATVVHCCDPTVVIDIEKIKFHAGSFEERILSKHKCDLTKKYIVLMMPDCLLTKKIHEAYSNEYQIITLFKPSKDADVYLYDLNPFEWASVLSKASLVITSYFHGTLLSLKHNAPVIAVDYSNYNDSCYEGKLKDLLHTRLDMPEFYYDSNSIEDEGTNTTMLHVIDMALSGNYTERIKLAMQREALSFENYYDLLKQIY